MFEVLKLNMQRLSAYEIARKLQMDPPAVYPSLNKAKENFAAADKMIKELKALGWPEKLPEIEQQIRNRSPKQRRAAPKDTEIPFKMG